MDNQDLDMRLKNILLENGADTLEIVKYMFFLGCVIVVSNVVSAFFILMLIKASVK